MGKEKGYTLVELIMVMAIFIVIIMVISFTFNTIVSRGGQQARSATGQIEGVVGLEMFRADVAHAGFALPWTYPGTFALAADAEVDAPPISTNLGIDPTDLNDTGPPRAVRGGLTTAGGLNPGGSHYLVLKSALLALNTTSSGRWGFVQYSSSSGGNASKIRTSGDAATNLRAGDRVITLLSAFSPTGAETKQLLVNAGVSPVAFADEVQSDFIPSDSAFMPADPSQNVLAYAISDTTLRMPYNRADYYIDFNAATRPQSCNPNTGVLFKAVAGQNGDYTDGTTPLLYPLLNCVADMQVVFALDPNDNGQMSHSSPDSFAVTALSAAQLRTQLKSIRVYILTHEGKKDTNFSYPGASIRVGEPGMPGRTWDGSASCAADCMTTFGADWRNYRWKVYSFVVNMNNL